MANLAFIEAVQVISKCIENPRLMINEASKSLKLQDEKRARALATYAAYKSGWAGVPTSNRSRVPPHEDIEPRRQAFVKTLVYLITHHQDGL